jgi:hypothetical protein
MIETPADLKDFLTAYAGALSGLDVDRLVDVHALPCLFVTDEYALAITDPGELRAALSLVLEFYGGVGMVTAAADLLDATVLNDAVIHVLVRWAFLDDAGERLAESDHFYLLRRREGALRIHTAVSTDGDRQLRDLFERLRATPW